VILSHCRFFILEYPDNTLIGIILFKTPPLADFYYLKIIVLYIEETRMENVLSVHTKHILIYKLRIIGAKGILKWRTKKQKL
jgi:hypothetical protein